MANAIIPAKHGAGFGTTWQCSECKKRYKSKGQTLTHIANIHKK